MDDSVKAAPSSGYQPDLQKLKRMVESAMSDTSNSRLQSLTDINFYHAEQWTPAERRTLKRRKQPDNVWNLTRLAINGTLGVVKQSSTDPRAFPRTPKDEDSADVVTKTLRFIADKNDLNAIVVECAFDYLVPGTCAALVEGDPNDRLKVKITQIRWEEFFADPYSRRKDFSDASFMGIARWMFADVVAELYPESKDEIERAISTTTLAGDTFDDRPSNAVASFAWSDKDKRRLMVIELYHREGGVWRKCVFHSGGVLESGDSPYVDEDGRACCPIEAQSCYVDVENNRSGIARDMRGPQLEINKRASKLLALVSMRQLQESAPGMGRGTIEEAKKEAAKPDGVIPPGWTVVQTGDMARGQAELLGRAQDLIERFAPNPARVGREAENQSGRASLIRQQAGMTELAVIIGGIEDWKLRIYRQMWLRARQFMTAPEYIRITDDEGAPQFIGVNQPIEGPPAPALDPATGQVVLQPTVAGVENELAKLDIDLILEAGPDTANVQQEQFAALMELGKLYGPQEVPFEDVLKLSALQGKREVLDARKARMEQAQQPTPAQQLQIAGAEAEIEKTRAETALTGAKARNEMLKPQMEALKVTMRSSLPAAGV